MTKMVFVVVELFSKHGRFNGTVEELWSHPCVFESERDAKEYIKKREADPVLHSNNLLKYDAVWCVSVRKPRSAWKKKRRSE